MEIEPFPAHPMLARRLLWSDAMKARKLSVKRPVKAAQVAQVELAALRGQADWQGLTALSDEALVALLIAPVHARKDAPAEAPPSEDDALARARRLLERAGGLVGLRQLRPHAYQTLDVLSPDEAARVAAALQLGYRAHQDDVLPAADRPFNSQLVIKWARPRLAGLEHEEVWVLCVNSHTALRSAWQVGRGGIHGCGLLARDILVPVVRDGASGFILVHNHPSGDPTPSPEDISLTRAISFAATSLCIPLLDHVVVARGGARSFFELGLLDR